MEDELAKIAVQCEQNALLRVGCRQYLLIAGSGTVGEYPWHIVSAIPESVH